MPPGVPAVEAVRAEGAAPNAADATERASQTSSRYTQHRQHTASKRPTTKSQSPPAEESSAPRLSKTARCKPYASNKRTKGKHLKEEPEPRSRTCGGKTDDRYEWRDSAERCSH